MQVQETRGAPGALESVPSRLRGTLLPPLAAGEFGPQYLAVAFVPQQALKLGYACGLPGLAPLSLRQFPACGKLNPMPLVSSLSRRDAKPGFASFIRRLAIAPASVFMQSGCTRYASTRNDCYQTNQKLFCEAVLHDYEVDQSNICLNFRGELRVPEFGRHPK